MSVAIDARGLKCPWPALRLARAMRTADDVTIVADDAAAPGELAALARTHGWTMVDVGEGGWRVQRPVN